MKMTNEKKVSKVGKARKLREKIYKNRKKFFIFLLLVTVINVYAIYKTKHLRDLGMDIVVSGIDLNEPWSSDTKLDIFNNPNEPWERKKLIYPGAHGEYQFIVRNDNGYTFNYNITCFDDDTKGVNMKYRIINNEYYDELKNTESWKSIDELKIEDTLNSYDSNEYTLEWKWFDAPNDTKIGLEGGTFTLHVVVSYEMEEDAE